MKETAFQLGMQYYDNDEGELVRSLSGFKLFQRGQSRKVTNILSIIERERGHELSLFDFSITLGGGKNQSKRKLTAFLVRSAHLRLPLFYLQPKNLMHKIGEYIGLTKDIGFDSHRIFTDSYLLQGNQEIDIRHVFNTDLLDFFSREEGWFLEGYGNDLLFYRESGYAKIAEVPGLFDKGEYLYSLFR
jgi:carbonic anhydrase